MAILAAHIRALGAHLGSDQQRPVASVLHLGAASAICAPLLATAAAAAIVPDVAAGQLRFGFAPHGPLQLALETVPRGGSPALLPDLAERIIDIGVLRLLAPFTRALTSAVPLPENTLQGNVFSALAAAARLIVPAPANARARALVDLVARRFGPLRDAGVLDWRAVDETDPQAYFRRRNCCLFYRIPSGGFCGDCLLTP